MYVANKPMAWMPHGRLRVPPNTERLETGPGGCLGQRAGIHGGPRQHPNLTSVYIRIYSNEVGGGRHSPCRNASK